MFEQEVQFFGRKKLQKMTSGYDFSD